MNQLNEVLDKRTEKEGIQQNIPQANSNLESGQKVLRPYSSFATSVKKDLQKVQQNLLYLIRYNIYLNFSKGYYKQ